MWLVSDPVLHCLLDFLQVGLKAALVPRNNCLNLDALHIGWEERGGWGRPRDRQTDRQTERERQRERHTQRERETERERERDSVTETDSETETDRD